jgi:hypothetical protein
MDLGGNSAPSVRCSLLGAAEVLVLVGPGSTGS